MVKSFIFSIYPNTWPVCIYYPIDFKTVKPIGPNFIFDKSHDPIKYLWTVANNNVDIFLMNQFKQKKSATFCFSQIVKKITS